MKRFNAVLEVNINLPTTQKYFGNIFSLSFISASNTWFLSSIYWQKEKSYIQDQKFIHKFYWTIGNIAQISYPKNQRYPSHYF